MTMRLSVETMRDRFYAADPAYDGRFVTGVVTTGIYCLPSCTARKPKVENIRFFDSEDDALGAGLRPCKRCKPDGFYRGEDRDLEVVCGLADRVRRDPAAFADASAMAADAGVGATKLSILFRDAYHTSPAAFLTQARVDAACAWLRDPANAVAEAGYAAGFESASAFHENFRRNTGMTPGEYRKLGSTNAFSITLPEGYRTDDVLRFVGRDADSRTERVSGPGFVKTFCHAAGTAVLNVEFEGSDARCSVSGNGPIGADLRYFAHHVALRLLGLKEDIGAFERRAAREPEIARLIAGRQGLRIPLTTDVFEGLVWAIVGQQVNLTFAATLRRALSALCGTDAGEGMLAPPAAQAVASLDVADLTRRQFSNRKAEYLIGAARQVVSGTLDIEAMTMRAAALVSKELLAVRGLGPWAVNYLMLRGCGFADCVPFGDTGLTSGLQRFFDLAERPDRDETERLMEAFRPHRSLATMHLWRIE
jgi:AraC family transcriptional regulator of adaptative response / DNA-3-methyladenine glycosylase II